jgi:hypothetical protein
MHKGSMFKADKLKPHLRGSKFVPCAEKKFNYAPVLAYREYVMKQTEA